MEISSQNWIKSAEPPRCKKRCSNIAARENKKLRINKINLGFLFNQLFNLPKTNLILSVIFRFSCNETFSELLSSSVFCKSLSDQRGHFSKSSL